MHAAASLIFSLPVWFLSTLQHPFGHGGLSGIPFAGILCLVFGVAVGVVRGQVRLLWFLAPLALSFAHVALAGLFHDRVRGLATLVVSLVFACVELASIGFALVRAKGGLLAAVPIAAFCLVFALFTAVVAAMAFSGEWL